MYKYISENLRTLSVTLSLLLFPNLVLALPKNVDVFIDKKIRQMTLDEKVGQLFIVGFPKIQVDKELEGFIQKHKPGSFLLFKRNIKSPDQIRILNETLYKISFQSSRLPPLIAIDQEGGAVSRLPIDPAPPNALAIGQTESPIVAEEMGFTTGRFLREVGFNMNLAPVLDIADPFSPSFIGVRSFGASAQLVRDMGFSYSQGLLRARVLPTAKHFPGTGNLIDDPHLKVAENKTALKDLYEKDLLPYRGFSGLGPASAVMLSHFIYPALDASKEPASFSKKIINDILRQELGFRGLIITDDLQMQGSRQLLRPEAAALKALQAGVDIVMLTYSFADQAKAFAYVKAAIQKGDLTKEAVDKKLQRILTAKAFANLYRRDIRLQTLVRGQSLTSSDYRKLEDKILEKNLKAALIPRTLPSKTSTTRKPASEIELGLCLLSPSKPFLDSFKKASPRIAQTKLLSGGVQGQVVHNWLAKNDCQQILFVATGPKTASLFYSLPSYAKKRAVVINLGAPKLFLRQQKSLRILNLYFNHEDSGKKVAEHLGEILSSSSSSVAIN